MSMTHDESKISYELSNLNNDLVANKRCKYPISLSVLLYVIRLIIHSVSLFAGASKEWLLHLPFVTELSAK